ncbi:MULTISPECIES: tRNA-uridine aminocarboxypropyltransferase [unclassified Marinobacterium]|uniref:tRNA-uridine aminocarboxypropyltransferase n=1 Tax=unclassified Marinobacterium TaxID=2644139 RepID=UPI00156A69E1|nr:MULTISPECIES: DTW domain-containing protein [unclassified Marinobacterium]NRP52425.1 DTW domain protein [Marinobacterium sp. xm-v-242]NRP77006.1 DTW domain protein [Marinobacterium sp. xm-m-383]
MPQVDNPPRKPFVTRGANVKRCEQCRLPITACICEYRSEVESQVEFVVLMHRYETYKPTNTGRLIADSIAKTRVIEWQGRKEPGDELTALLNDPSYQPIIVFPPAEDYLERMTTPVQVQQNSAKPLLILLDGTWRQARRIFRHSDYLQHLPVISLDEVRESSYGLRKAIHEGQLCTAEVAIALLEQLGDEPAANHLNAYFKRFNQHYVASRGRLAKRDRDTGELV